MFLDLEKEWTGMDSDVSFEERSDEGQENFDPGPGPKTPEQWELFDMLLKKKLFLAALQSLFEEKLLEEGRLFRAKYLAANKDKPKPVCQRSGGPALPLTSEEWEQALREW